MACSIPFRIQAMAESLTHEDGDTGRPSAQADRLVELVWKKDVTLFHDHFREPFARIHIGEHWEVHRLRSKHFRRWLCALLWEAERKAPNTNAIASALAVLEGKACFEGPKTALENRTAWFGDAIWYDLTNDNWEAVKVTAEGWEVVKIPPILFRRFSHMQPQVTPTKGGDIRLLQSFFNLAEPRFSDLLLVYAVTCLIPEIPHPAPLFHGEQGAAKTTLAKMLRKLIDPSGIGTLSLPTNATELVQQIFHHWFAFFDNVTYLPDWASDALCRAVTGDGFSKRELYSDDEDVIYSFQRCIGLNGINLAAQKPDLLDRGIILNLERIGKAERKSERDIWDAFERARPAILGGMFDVLSAAMRIHKEIRLKETPRMADFAHWGAAIAKAMGSSPETFLALYFENIGQQHEEVVNADLVAGALVKFMESRKTWEGSASELLKILRETAESERVDTHAKLWPKAPNSLSRRLNEVRTNLAEVGIAIELLRDANGKRRIRIQNPSGDTDGTDDVFGSSSSLPNL
ncbi:MAG: hypothetical protein PHZ00_01255 [Candidatus Peribacteraceae bacterium]|nr:hypothetical protein [Candidatus Peribacteraceae bacterium]